MHDADRPARRRRRWLPLVRLTLVAAAAILAIRVGGCAERLFYHPTREPTPAPREWPGARVVRFDSRDGTRLCGWFIPAAAPGAASVLHVHGNAGNMNSHIGFTEFLIDAGFNLFIFDFRGYGESEGAATTRAALIDDSSAALDALLAQAEVDPDRIGLFGQSLGAAIGANLLARRSELRAAVFESPFASWRLAAATALGGGDPGWLARGAAALLIDDRDRPIDAVAQCSVPILILHGDADRIVPIVHGRLLRDAAPDRVTLVEFAGGDHNSLGMTHPESHRGAIEFFRRHLAPRGSGDAHGAPAAP